MPTLYYADEAVEAKSQETVLEALLRHGHEVTYSCRTGVCHSCLMRCARGNPGEASQRSLKPTLREQGYFLPCTARPDGDLEIASDASAALSIRATVQQVAPLSQNVVRLVLAPDEGLEHRPGQFVNLVRPRDGLVRSYSIASAPGWRGPTAAPDRAESGAAPPHLELHVRRIEGGQMSNWIASELAAGDELFLRGPAGECFYTEGAPEQPMLLAGTGTGLAPLWGIARDALSRGHRGRIALYHGALDARGLYLVEELQALAAAHSNLTYRRCLLRGEGVDADADDVLLGPLDQRLSRKSGDLAGWRVFLCGDPELVHRMRKLAFLAGVSMNDIFADAFLTAGSTG